MLKPINYRQVQDVLDAVTRPDRGLKVADLVRVYISDDWSFAEGVDGTIHQFDEGNATDQIVRGVLADLHGGEVLSLNVRMFPDKPHWYEADVRTDIPIVTGPRGTSYFFENLAGWVVA